MRSVDPYPDPESGSGIRIQEGKNGPQKYFKKTKEILCFEVLDGLSWGLKDSYVAWTSFMEAQG